VKGGERPREKKIRPGRGGKSCFRRGGKPCELMNTKLTSKTRLTKGKELGPTVRKRKKKVAGRGGEKKRFLINNGENDNYYLSWKKKELAGKTFLAVKDQSDQIRTADQRSQMGKKTGGPNLKNKKDLKKGKLAPSPLAARSRGERTGKIPV